MRACPECGCHGRSEERACPHCGAALSTGSALPRTAAATLMGLALVGCIDMSKPQALYGAVRVDTGDSGDATTDTAVDADGDGFSEDDGDCDDGDEDVNPDADETPGDGIDSNCDGDDDT
jgi:hypothetical protein